MDIKPAIAVIIFDDKKRVLLQRRADVNLWGIPSGHVEPGETIIEAAIREVYEETSLKISIEKLIGVYSEPDSQVFSYPNGRIVHFVTNYFLASIQEGYLHCNDGESLDYRFFSINELPKNIIKMHPSWLEDALANEKHSFIR